VTSLRANSLRLGRRAATASAVESDQIARWKLNELAHNRQVKDLRTGSRVQCELILYSKRPNRHAWPVHASRSSRVPAPPGIHIHLGQTLIVTSGFGWAQRWGGPIEEIRPGDVIWFSPNEKHWHGGTPTTAMTHIAIQEALNGKPVDWMEHVTDEQYRRS
jgi:mannose-6-phosphate isomerase-like protein (cupin superfamily)